MIDLKQFKDKKLAHSIAQNIQPHSEKDIVTEQFSKVKKNKTANMKGIVKNLL